MMCVAGGVVALGAVAGGWGLRGASRGAAVRADNDIEAAGAASLAPSLALMAQLTSRDLGDNALGDAGAASLAPSLARITLLMSLDLRNNLIGAAGAALLPRFARIAADA